MEKEVELGKKFALHYGHIDWTRLTIGQSGAEAYQADQFILKKQSKTAESSLFDEKCKIEWLTGRAPVPAVVDYEVDEVFEYLLISRLVGRDAAQTRWTDDDPKRLVAQLGRALRDLHDKIDVNGCPFDARLVHKFASASRQLKALGADDNRLDELIAQAPSEDLVFTHGDYCLPNIIVDDDECRLVGFVDLGRAGVADRYYDLALGLRSIQYNLGEGYAQDFIQAYGIDFHHRNEQKIDFYQKLDELL